MAAAWYTTLAVLLVLIQVATCQRTLYRTKRYVQQPKRIIRNVYNVEEPNTAIPEKVEPLTRRFVARPQNEFFFSEPQFFYQFEQQQPNFMFEEPPMFFQFFPDQSFHFIQEPSFEPFVQEQQQQEFFTNFPEPQEQIQPPPAVPFVEEKALEQENDPVETREYINKANVNIEKIFKRANDEIERTNQKMVEQSQSTRNAINQLAEKGGDLITKGLKGSLTDCLRTVDAEVKATSKANAAVGMQCIEKAKKAGAEARSKAQKELENDHELAAGQNEMNTEALSMCASSQFTLCVEERTHLRHSVLAADAAAKINVAKAKDSVASEMEQLAQCLDEAVEDFEDMKFDAENGVTLCNSSA